MLPDYSRLKLDLAGARLDAATTATVDALNASIQSIVWSAVFGGDGAARQVTSFAVKQKADQVATEQDKLTAVRTKLEQVAESDRTPGQQKQLKQIVKRLADLDQIKQRLAAVLV